MGRNSFNLDGTQVTKMKCNPPFFQPKQGSFTGNHAFVNLGPPGVHNYFRFLIDQSGQF
jgi:hypothetical protein